MKQILTLVMMLVVAIGAQAQVDDMYFVPKKKKAKTVEEDASYSFETTQERVTLPERDTDEYNRRRSVADTSYDNDEEYSGEEYTEDVEDTEYRYSSRIVRFHNPHRVIVSSPWYWDVVYTSGVDNWVVYDDGIYWEVYPTYTPWYYPAWSWNYGWGCYPSYWGHYAYYGGWCSWPHWWSNHYHFHHNWGGHFNNHFAGGGHFRNGKVPPITDLRGGNTIARGTNIERNNGLRRGDSSDRLAQNRGGNRGGTRIDRGAVSRRGETGNNRGNVGERRNRNDRSSVGTNSERRTNNRGSVRQNSDKERNYDRPSSTRNTQRSSSVERSSSNNRSYSSGSSRSGGSSRGSGVSRSGGGSRGGGRR